MSEETLNEDLAAVAGVAGEAETQAPRNGQKLRRRFKLTEPRTPNTYDGTVIYDGLKLSVNLPSDEEYEALIKEQDAVTAQVTKRLMDDPDANASDVRRLYWLPFRQKIIKEWWRGIDGVAISDDEKLEYQYADLVAISDLIIAKAREGFAGLNFSSGS